MKRKAKKLTPKQIHFLQNYFLSGSIEEACRKTGVSRQIYYEWLSNPEFKKALEDSRQNYLNLVMGEIEKSIEGAIRVLRDALNDKSGYIRLRAAQLILDYSLKLRERLELEERIKKIEECLEKQGVKL